MKRLEDFKSSHPRLAECEEELTNAKELLLHASEKNTTMEGEVDWLRHCVGQERIEKTKANKMRATFEEAAAEAKRDAARARAQVAEKEREVSSSMCTRSCIHPNVCMQVALLKQKLRALSRSARQTSKLAEDKDDSLVIEPPVLGSSN